MHLCYEAHVNDNFSFLPYNHFMKISRYILILIPLLELIAFIEIGSYIGSLNVILWIFLTIFIDIFNKIETEKYKVEFI